MNIRTLPVAEDELAAAARRLERARPRWGGRLLSEYHAALENVERFPQLYPLVEDEVPDREFRNAIFERLKYRVVYEVRSDEVVVVAVLHTDRRPNLWHFRLDELPPEDPS